MKRPLLGFALAFTTGVLASLYVIPFPFLIWAAAAAMFAGAVAAWLWRGKRGICMVVTVGLALGTVWTWGYTRLVYVPTEHLNGAKIDAELELLEYPQREKYGASCVVSVRGMSGRMIYYGDASLLELSPGDVLRGRIRCQSALEVGGEKSTYYASQGVVLRLYPEGEMTTALFKESKLRYFPQELKSSLQNAAAKLYSEETRGFILALLTGEKSELDEQATTDLEESGLTHLTAVSGLHCGFLIAFLGLLIGGNGYLRALVGYPLLLLYMFMVGCTPSVIRACVMVGLVIAGDLFERDTDPPTSLGAAALVILLADPYAAGAVSFQLSFAAVAGILVVSPRIYAGINGLRRWKHKSVRRIWMLFSASVSASVGALVFTAPISAYYFKSISLVSSLSNLLVFPVVSALFAVSLVLTLLAIVFPGLSALSFVPELLARYVLGAASFAAKIPGHAVSFSGYAVLMWFLLVYAMFAVCWFSPDGKRKYILAAVLSAVSLGAARLLPMALVADDALTVVAVNVGQGAATLLHADDATALVDCGSYYSPRGSGADVSDTMQMYGWKRLDYVILTHYHEDHAGGVDELLARVRVDTLLLPRASEEEKLLHDEVIALAQRYGITVCYVDAVTETTLGSAVLTVYPQLTFGRVNEEGLTVLCTEGEFDLIITGDMGASTERRLISTYALPDIEVLMVGHHGSKTSTSRELLEMLRPEVGIISVGENSYGHPEKEVLERLAQHGCAVYRTDRSGNIVIHVHE